MTDQPDLSPSTFTSHLETLNKGIDTLLQQATNLCELADLADNASEAMVLDLQLAIAHLESVGTWLKSAARSSERRVTSQEFQDNAKVAEA
jgi:hypothetical protein